MDGFKSTDEIIRQAFALAYFIHGDEAQALAVVRAATAKLEVAAAAQVKRLYYSPTRRPLWPRAKPSQGRTRVSLSDTHLLQRLIYVESEPYERERERSPGALRDEDLLIHFVKHLIRISIKRNSFYVALGVSRLLHNYSTNETMEIYNVVVQDPERVKDDYYYRSRKGRLLQEIKERFEEFVAVRRGSRGEERFQTLDAPGEFAGLVAECLRQFSPWRTPCSIPERYDPTSDEIPTLSSAHQSEEDKVEINRIHAVVHPDCYELLTTALKLDPPATRLSVPRFNLPNGTNNMSRPKDKPRRPAPPLDVSELEALKRILGEQAARRKTTHAGLLSVVVNGVERARLDLGSSGSVSFEVRDADELVEVRSLDGDGWTLLATHLLGGEPQDAARPAKSEIVLEGGQKLSFRLSSAQGGPDEAAPTLLNISYRETEWLRAASLFRRRLMRGMIARAGFGARSGAAFARPAFVALLLIICAGAAAFYVFRNTRGPDAARLAANIAQPLANQPGSDAARNASRTQTSDNAPSENSAVSAPAPQDTLATATPKTNDQPRENRASGAETMPAEITRAAVTKRPATTAQAARTDVRAGRPAQAELSSGRATSETGDGSSAGTRPLDSNAARLDSDATRSVEATAGATALSKVRKVFIEVTGERGLSEQTSRLLAGSLRDGRRLIPTDVKDEADAAFKIKVSERPTASAPPDDQTSREPESRLVTVSVRLVNEDGEVIWPAKRKGHASTYTGTVRDVARRVAGDLLKDVLKSDARK